MKNATYPTHFLTDKGDKFRVRINKTNKKTFILTLLGKGGERLKTIKVNRSSKKLIYPTGARR